MKNLKPLFLGIALICFAKFSFAQSSETSDFTGAVPTLNDYKALYVLNSSDPKQIDATLRNIDNVLGDPRLEGKLHIELVVFSGGVDAFKKSGPYKETLEALVAKGVVLQQCENTIRQRKIEKSELFDFVSYVPTGNGEIILRHYEGWAIVKP